PPHPLLPIQPLDQLHTPVLTHRTLGAWLPRWHRGRLTVHRRFLGTRGTDVPQQRAALREFLRAYAIRQEAEVPHPVEAAWRDVEHQPPQKFHGLEREGAQAVAARVVLIAKGHLAVLQGKEAVVRDRHTMRVAGQVLEDMLGVTERFFGVDYPFLVAQRREEMLPGCGLDECPTTTRQGQLALRVGLRKAREVEA